VPTIKQMRRVRTIAGFLEGNAICKRPRSDFDPDLARVIDAWPQLPDALKAAILAIVAD